MAMQVRWDINNWSDESTYCQAQLIHVWFYHTRCFARKRNPLQNICNNFRIIKQTNRNTIRQKGKGVVINHGKGGGCYKMGGGGGKWSFTPTKKRGARAAKVFAILRGGGGHNKFWGSFSTGAWSFNHAGGRGGGTIGFHPLKGGGGGRRGRKKFYPVPIL